MNNDWKPTEQNIGQPVKPSGDNLPYPYTTPVGTSLIYSKWYDVDTTKITSIKDVGALFSAIKMRVSETYERFDEVKHLLIIPEQPKTLDEIKEEFDEKMDELLVKTKRKFAVSKQTAEYHYNVKFDKIIQDFEYAVRNGNFPFKLNFTCGIGVSGSPVEPSRVQHVKTSFVIKQGNKHEGYYTFGNGRYIKYYMPTKPNMIVRFFMKTCLALRWVDEHYD